MHQVEANGRKQEREGNGERHNDAPRTLPRNRKRMMETRRTPAVRLCSTVETVT